MSKPRKPQTLIRQAKTEKQRWTLLRAATDELRQMAKEGIVPDDAAEKYHPVRVLIRIAEDPNMLPSFRLLASKEILQYIEAPKSAAMRLEAAAGGDTQITVVIAPWAAGRPSAPALPAPAIDVTDFTANDPDAVRTDNSTPSPELSDRERLRRTAAASAETVVFDVPAAPDKPRVEVARVSASRGLSLKRGGFLGPGVSDAAPETPVEKTFNLFGR